MVLIVVAAAGVADSTKLGTELGVPDASFFFLFDALEGGPNGGVVLPEQGALEYVLPKDPKVVVCSIDIDIVGVVFVVAGHGHCVARLDFFVGSGCGDVLFAARGRHSIASEMERNRIDGSILCSVSLVAARE